MFLKTYAHWQDQGLRGNLVLSTKWSHICWVQSMDSGASLSLFVSKLHQSGPVWIWVTYFPLMFLSFLVCKTATKEPSCGRQNNVPSEMSVPFPGTYEYVGFYSKRESRLQMESMLTLKPGGYACRPNVIKRVFKSGRGKKKRIRERFKDAMLVALNMEKEATSQGMQVVSRIWKRQRFSPEPLEIMQPCQYLDINQVRPPWYFWPPTL